LKLWARCVVGVGQEQWCCPGAVPGFGPERHGIPDAAVEETGCVGSEELVHRATGSGRPCRPSGNTRCHVSGMRNRWSQRTVRFRMSCG